MRAVAQLPLALVLPLALTLASVVSVGRGFADSEAARALPVDSSSTNSAGAGCGDAAADNYDPISNTPPGDNSICSYSCATLLAHFKLPPSAGECWIDAGSSSGRRRWPPAPVGQTNNTYVVPSWTTTKAVVIQGRARGPLPSRVDAVGVGVTLVLRHVNMSALAAVGGSGGAVYVSEGALTVEHAVFYANSAAQVGPSVPAVLRRVSPLLTGARCVQDGGAIHVRYGSGATRLVGCAFDLNRAHYGGAVYVYKRGGPTTIDDCVFRHNHASVRTSRSIQLQATSSNAQRLLRRVMAARSRQLPTRGGWRSAPAPSTPTPPPLCVRLALHPHASSLRLSPLILIAGRRGAVPARQHGGGGGQLQLPGQHRCREPVPPPPLADASAL
jgi:hypothetical protein